MLIQVPRSLMGGSLLDAHKWVKSEMARSNPVASADYTLQDRYGNQLKLSDLTSNAGPGEVMIISGKGVRSNPTPSLPTDFHSFPSHGTRLGNYATQLLPNAVSPAMVERLVAEEGVFSAVQTLTILAGKRSNIDELSPNVASLLFAMNRNNAIRKNPSIKTPFLGDTVEDMFNSEIAILRYLDDKGLENVTDNMSKLEGLRIPSKYKLNSYTLEKFTTDVISPFLAVASANRGALRAISRGMKKHGIHKGSSFKKLVELLPTKPEQFYYGKEFALIADKAFIRPLDAAIILNKDMIEGLLSFAERFPDNVDMQGTKLKLKLDRKEKKALQVAGQDKWWNRFLRRVFDDDALLDILKGMPDDEMIKEIADASGLNQTGAPLIKGKPFVVHKNIAGMYPSPPNEWPPALVYAIMDTFLVNLPKIYKIDNKGAGNHLPRIYTGIAAESGGISEQVEVKVGEETYSLTELVDRKGPISNETKRKAIVEKIPKLKALDESSKETLISGASASTNLLTKLLEMVEISTDSVIKLDPSGGISYIELLHESVEISKGKYNYTPSGEDFSFALGLIDFTVQELFTEQIRSAPAPPIIETKEVFKPFEDMNEEERYAALADLGISEYTDSEGITRRQVTLPGGRAMYGEVLEAERERSVLDQLQEVMGSGKYGPKVLTMKDLAGLAVPERDGPKKRREDMAREFFRRYPGDEIDRFPMGPIKGRGTFEETGPELYGANVKGQVDAGKRRVMFDSTSTMETPLGRKDRIAAIIAADLAARGVPRAPLSPDEINALLEGTSPKSDIDEWVARLNPGGGALEASLNALLTMTSGLMQRIDATEDEWTRKTITFHQQIMTQVNEMVEATKRIEFHDNAGKEVLENEQAALEILENEVEETIQMIKSYSVTIAALRKTAKDLIDTNKTLSGKNETHNRKVASYLILTEMWNEDNLDDCGDKLESTLTSLRNEGGSALTANLQTVLAVAAKLCKNSYQSYEKQRELIQVAKSLKGKVFNRYTHTKLSKKIQKTLSDILQAEQRLFDHDGARLEVGNLGEVADAIHLRLDQTKRSGLISANSDIEYNFRQALTIM